MRLAQKRTPARAVLATLAAAVLALSACSGGGGRSAADLPAFHPNIATWRLPIDAYLPDLFTDQYASNLIYGECMTAAGSPAVVDNPTANRSPVVNPRGRRLFTLQFAERWGYGGPITPDGPVESPLSSRDVIQGKRCSTVANKLVGYTDDQNRIQGEGAGAYDATEHDPRELRAVRRWRHCMLPLGIADLAPIPNEQPSQSQKALFRRLSAKHPGVASPEEIRDAVFDAKCRLSSGYQATAYKVEVENQLRLIKDDPDLFVRALAERKRQRAEERKVFARHGR